MAKAKGRIPPKPKTPTVVPEAEKHLDAVASQEKIKLLLMGKTAPPNEIVGYLVNQYREARAEFEATDSAVRNLEKQLSQAKNKRLVLEGGVNKYMNDLRHWLSRADTEAKTQDPRPAPTPVSKPN